MKNKTIYIALIIFVVVFGFAIYAKYVDSARVRAGREPKLVIKIVSNDGSKVTYWGLGYKVIGYVSVSPNEPYVNHICSKMGSWFMKYELESSNNKISEIIDTTKQIKDFACAEALEQFYEDENYIYYYSCIKSSYVIVRYKSGLEMTVQEALKQGHISIQDLDEYKIEYIKSKRQN